MFKRLAMLCLYIETIPLMERAWPPCATNMTAKKAALRDCTSIEVPIGTQVSQHLLPWSECCYSFYGQNSCGPVYVNSALMLELVRLDAFSR